MLDKYFRAFQFLGGAVVRKKCRDLCFRELVVLRGMEGHMS